MKIDFNIYLVKLNKIDFFKFFEKYHVFLILIIAIASYLRLSGLTTQSLWLDELHTMNETNPNLTLGEIFTILQNVDQHPPLYFYSIHYWFTYFEYSDFAARLFSAILGIISIYTTYLFAKELTNNRVALIAILILSVNFFHITYSQEARDYILAYLFSTLSFYYLFKSINNLSYKNCLLFGLNATLLMYSHYFGIFAVISQFVIIAIVIINSSFNTLKVKILHFGASSLLILLLYGQWLPTIIHLSKSIKSFWIQPVPSDFFITYFSEYFGNSSILILFISLLIIGGLIKVFFYNNIEEDQKISNAYIVIYLIVSIFITCYIPYIRSLLVVPMIVSRYTIVILPSLVILIAFSINLISSKVLKNFSLIFIILLSFLNLFGEKKYYKNVSKEQFREQSEFVINSNIFNYPVYSDKSWYYNYYFNKVNKNVNSVISSDILLAKHNDSTQTNGFWVLDAHGGDPYKDQITKDLISKEYECIKENYLFGTWAKFYVKTNNISTSIRNTTGGNIIENNISALWNNGKIETKSINLSKGKHTLLIYCFGSKADEKFPHINVFWNNIKIGEITTNENLDNYNLKFNLNYNETGKISFSFDNDHFINGEDRNFYLKFIDIR